MTTKITYHIATKRDCEAIARLHAQSWKESYRGMLTDEYLDTKVDAERLAVWQKRFDYPSPNQYIKVAKIGDELVGFACTFFDYDSEWGAMLDNLHVFTKWKKNGIGKALVKDAIEATLKNNPNSKLYLWVLEDNKSAIKFYDKLGGQNVEKKPLELAGIWVDSFRYVFSKLF